MVQRNGRTVANGNGNGYVGSQVVPWVAVFITFIGIGWNVINPRDDMKQERVDRAEAIRQLRMDIESELKAMVSRDMYGAYLIANDKQVDLLRSGVIEMRRGMVSREEHIQHWKEIDDKNANNREQIMELRRDFTGTYSIGDQLKNLQKQVDDLRSRSPTMAPRGSTVVVPPAP